MAEASSDTAKSIVAMNKEPDDQTLFRIYPQVWMDLMFMMFRFGKILCLPSFSFEDFEEEVLKEANNYRADDQASIHRSVLLSKILDSLLSDVVSKTKIVHNREEKLVEFAKQYFKRNPFGDSKTFDFHMLPSDIKVWVYLEMCNHYCNLPRIQETDEFKSANLLQVKEFGPIATGEVYQYFDGFKLFQKHDADKFKEREPAIGKAFESEPWSSIYVEISHGVHFECVANDTTTWHGIIQKLDDSGVFNDILIGSQLKLILQSIKAKFDECLSTKKPVCDASNGEPSIGRQRLTSTTEKNGDSDTNKEGNRKVSAESNRRRHLNSTSHDHKYFDSPPESPNSLKEVNVDNFKIDKPPISPHSNEMPLNNFEPTDELSLAQMVKLKDLIGRTKPMHHYPMPVPHDTPPVQRALIAKARRAANPEDISLFSDDSNGESSSSSPTKPTYFPVGTRAPPPPPPVVVTPTPPKPPVAIPKFPRLNGEVIRRLNEQEKAAQKAKAKAAAAAKRAMKKIDKQPPISLKRAEPSSDDTPDEIPAVVFQTIDELAAERARKIAAGILPPVKRRRKNARVEVNKEVAQPEEPNEPLPPEINKIITAIMFAQQEFGKIVESWKVEQNIAQAPREMEQLFNAIPENYYSISMSQWANIKNLIFKAPLRFSGFEGHIPQDKGQPVRDLGATLMKVTLDAWPIIFTSVSDEDKEFLKRTEESFFKCCAVTDAFHMLCQNVIESKENTEVEYLDGLTALKVSLGKVLAGPRIVACAINDDLTVTALMANVRVQD